MQKEIKIIENLNTFIKEFTESTGNSSNSISDGYHTFGDLYNFRKLYNAALFNEWATENSHEEEVFIQPMSVAQAKESKTRTNTYYNKLKKEENGTQFKH